MKVLLLLLLLLSIPLAASAADCGNTCLAVPAVTLGRLGLQEPVPCMCNGETPTNLNWDYLDAHACTDDRVCGKSTVSVMRENVAAGDDNLSFFTPSAASTLVSVGCRCDANCTTPATLSFATGVGAGIALTGGGDLSCSSATTMSFTTFSTSDSDRFLVSNAILQSSVTNIPTAGQRIFFTVVYTTP